MGSRVAAALPWLLALIFSVADGTTSRFTRLSGAAGAETTGRSVAVDSSNNVFVTGQTEGNLDGHTITGTRDLIVVKYDNMGTKQYTRLLGVAGAKTWGRSVAVDSGNNVVATGSTEGNLDGHTKTGDRDLIVVKYDNMGTKQYTRLLGVAGAMTNGLGVAVDSNNNVFVTGYTGGNLDGQTKTGARDVFVVKYDNTGTKQYTRLLGATGAYTDGLGVAVDSNNNVFVAGYTSGNLDGQTKTGNGDLFLVKYDNAGAKQYTRLLGVAGATTGAYQVAVDSNNNVLVTGSTGGMLDGELMTGTQDLFLVKYDNMGTKQYTRLLGAESASTDGYGVAVDSNNNVFVTGLTEGNLDGQTKTGTWDLFLVKYDNTGTKQYTRLLGVAGAKTWGRSVAVNTNNNVFVTGHTEGNLDGQTKTGTEDLIVVKFITAVPTPAPTVVMPGMPSQGVAHGIRVPHMSVAENIGLKADITVHWQATSGLDAVAVSHSLDWIGLFKKGACRQTRNMATASNGQNECYLAAMTLGTPGTPGGATAGSVTFLYTDTRWPAGEYEARYFLGDSQKGNGMVCKTLDNAGPGVLTQSCGLEAAATSNSFTITNGIDDYQDKIRAGVPQIPGFETGL